MKNKKWDTIFSTGTHTDSKGRKRTWTIADLDELAKSSDVPVVVHHPKESKKAVTFAKTAEIRRMGNRLQARYKDISKGLEAAVKEGLRLAKSVSINPETMRLDHIGMLGYEQHPALDGLGAINFTRDAAHLTYTEKSKMTDKERIAELEAKIAELKTRQGIADVEKKLEHSKSELAAEQDAHKATKIEFEKYKQETEERALSARIDALAESGRILPAEKNKIISFAKAMDDGKASMDFSRADGTSEKVSPREAWLRELEAKEPVHKVLTSEFAQHGGTTEESVDMSTINDYA